MKKECDKYVFFLIARESNVEIRDLEAKLRQAYVNRALAVQIAQKEVTQKREKELREAEHQVFYTI